MTTTSRIAGLYARGGSPITTRSRFMKTPDVFRTDIERSGYGKAGWWLAVEG
jgi:hypothetical protein